MYLYSQSEVRFFLLNNNFKKMASSLKHIKTTLLLTYCARPALAIL